MNNGEIARRARYIDRLLALERKKSLKEVRRQVKLARKQLRDQMAKRPKYIFPFIEKQRYRLALTDLDNEILKRLKKMEVKDVISD